MDYKYINQLLDRYWKCETSLEEEKILRAFFSQKDVPAELETYKELFIYEQNEKVTDVLDDDFDQKMMTLIDNNEHIAHLHKARFVTISNNLKPLFKAAAIVAIFLTLGNASQVAFNEEDEFINTGTTEQLYKGASVAMGDSAVIDSMQHSSIETTTEAENILK